MPGRILESDEDIGAALKSARRLAIIGAKPESHSWAPAHYVPAYLQRAGYEIIPVPVYYPEVTEILGEQVFRDLRDIPGAVDMVVLFRRSADVAKHVDEILAATPQTVWMQAGISNDAVARTLTDAGIDVVQDRCTMVEHRMR